MKFALDWDGTASDDQGLWMAFVMRAQSRGHEVHIVTMRYPSEFKNPRSSIPDEWVELVDGLHFTSRQAKRPFMEAKGIMIDVWIDDNPEAVKDDASVVFPVVTLEGDVQSGVSTLAHTTPDDKKWTVWKEEVIYEPPRTEDPLVN